MSCSKCLEGTDFLYSNLCIRGQSEMDIQGQYCEALKLNWIRSSSAMHEKGNLLVRHDLHCQKGSLLFENSILSDTVRPLHLLWTRQQQEGHCNIFAFVTSFLGFLKHTGHEQSTFFIPSFTSEITLEGLLCLHFQNWKQFWPNQGSLLQ